MNAVPGLLLDLLLLTLFGLGMARDMRRRPGSGFFRPVMLGFIPVAFFSLLVFSSLQQDEPEVRAFKASFVSQLSQATVALTQGQGNLKPEDVRPAAELLLRLYPGLQCLFWLCALCVIALLLRRWMFSRGWTKLPGPLSRWRAPDALIWMVLLPAGLVLFGDRGMLGQVEPWLRDLCLNVLVLSLAIYAFQGTMVLVERLNRVGMPKFVGVLLVALGLVLALLPQGRGLALGILALGLLDAWFDFRNSQKKESD